MAQHVMESREDKMQQVEYNLEYLEVKNNVFHSAVITCVLQKSIEYFDQLQLECSKPWQVHC